MRLLVAGVLLPAGTVTASEVKLLNVSYDVTREFYQDYNAAFAKYWKEKTGDIVTVNQSHGGSSKQAQSVVNGLEADVVTMNQAPDIDVLHTSGGLIPANWAARLPNQSVPYTSTIVFVVRKDNPKNIKNWDDLVRPDVSVIVPNPKTSGNGRYSYLAAWGYALKKSAGDEKQARAFVAKLFANVPVLDTGGRGATTTFAERGIGDVLLTFENEAALIQKQFYGQSARGRAPARQHSGGKSRGLGGHNVVNGITRKPIARAYLEYLYSDAGQELAAPNIISVRKTRRCLPDMPTVSSRWIYSRWRKWRAAGKTHKRFISPTAESLTRFTRINDEFADAVQGEAQLEQFTKADRFTGGSSTKDKT